MTPEAQVVALVALRQRLTAERKRITDELTEIPAAEPLPAVAMQALALVECAIDATDAEIARHTPFPGHGSES